MPRARNARKRNSKFGRLKLQSINKKREKELEKLAQKQHKHERKPSVEEKKELKSHVSVITIGISCLVIVLIVASIPLVNMLFSQIFSSNNSNRSK